MARLIDETKLDRIKQSALELVVSNGYGGAAVSAIARSAGVAEGYLYRFYSGKQQLVEALLFEKVERILLRLETLLAGCERSSEIFAQLIREFFSMAETSPVDIQFIHVLMHDYNFQISDNQRKQIITLCSRVKALGSSQSEIRDEVTEEDIFVMAIIYPIEIINLHMKGFFGRPGWSEEDQQKVIDFSIKALK